MPSGRLGHRGPGESAYADLRILPVSEARTRYSINLKVAERFVDAFSSLAKTGNTLIIPANVADVAGLVSSAMTVVKKTGTGN